MKKLFIFSLMLASTAIATAQTKVYYGAKLEPKEGILLGAGQSDYFTKSNDYFASYNGFVKATGIVPAITMDYVPVGFSLAEIRGRFAEIRAGLQPGIQLNIGVTFTGAGLMNASKNLLKDIITGKYDANFIEIGKQIASLNTDCFLRLGHEFDLASNKYLGQDYKKAYVRAAGLLRGQSNRIALVWCSAGGSGGRWGDSAQMNKSYPGDAYVDWFGADVFDAGEWGGKAMASFLAYAAAHKKPVMIGETTPRGVGVLGGLTSWNKWFVPMFATLAANPIIKAVCYINWDWAAANKERYNPGWGNWGDARLEKSAVVAAGFVAGYKALMLPTAPVVNDTFRVRVFYPFNLQVTHDSTITLDSIRVDIVPRK